MPYGFQLYKANGESVFGESGRPFLMISGDQVMNGTTLTLSGVSHFWYPLATVSTTPRNFPAFCQLSIGQYICGYSNGTTFGYLSNKSSFTFKYFRPANELPNPTGYDVVSYGPTGQKLWIASESAVTLSGRYSCPFATTPVAVNTARPANWVALTTHRVRIIPGATNGGANGLAIAQGIIRDSSLGWKYHGVSIGVAPNQDVPPVSMSFLGAY